MKKKWTTLGVFVLLLIVNFFRMSAEAKTMPKIGPEILTQFNANECVTEKELFSGYVEKILYEGIKETVSMYGTVGNQRLETEEAKIVYSALKAEVENVAAGEVESTHIIINKRLQWTAEELGVSQITSSNYQNLAVAKFTEVVDMDTLLKYLLMDCPYELYWYDKTQPTYTSLGISYNEKSVSVAKIIVKMPVVSNFRNGDIYTMNTALAKSVQGTKEKAQQIVLANEEASEYEKLLAYKNAICEMTDYNHIVNDSTEYGNPWQVIWVFDDDPSTRVVCEGFAKAFQYLCDLSELNCYTINGTMEGGTGAGTHMWNIVTLEDKNYLVDVTNCDVGSIGYSDLLFLAGTEKGSVEEGYIFPLKFDVIYKYKENQVALLGEDVLTLASEKYVPKVVEETPEITPEVTPEETPEITSEITPEATPEETPEITPEATPEETPAETPEVTPEDKEEIVTTPVTELFLDVSANAWYKESVQFVYDYGLMSGSEKLFKPSNSVTRAMVVTTLYRMAGAPAVTDNKACLVFGDVKENKWYTDAVCWAYENGVTTGNPNTMTFQVNDLVTRQQLAAFFFRYARLFDYDISVKTDISQMYGAKSVSPYAKEAIEWSVGAGLLSGSQSVDQEGKPIKDLAPQNGATRAQLATILKRFYEKYDI